MRRRAARLGALAALLIAATPAAAAPVLMISVDGLRPGDVLEAEARGLKVPSLRRLAAEGVYATGVRNTLPTDTYPNHTTLITGVWPARHGIADNVVFDPLQANMGGWYWYAADIKVPTLWDAAHRAGMRVASFSWPVSVGAAAIDDNLPEYWRAKTADDLKLIRALATPGLVADLEKTTGLPMLLTMGGNIQSDDGRATYAAAEFAARHPGFTTIHLQALDGAQHKFGPGSREARAVLERQDAIIGRLVAAARAAEPDLVVAVVSDHGFAPLEHDVNILGAFVEAGLITLDPKTGRPASWEAMPWGTVSAPVYLKRPDDPALKAKVAALLARLAARPELGVNRVIDAGEIARMGGTPQASFWIDFKPGYGGGDDPRAPTVAPSVEKGEHGYFPEHPQMRATFILAGPGVAAKGPLGEVDMRDIAPTLAKILGVALPTAEGKPLL